LLCEWIISSLSRHPSLINPLYLTLDPPINNCGFIWRGEEEEEIKLGRWVDWTTIRNRGLIE